MMNYLQYVAVSCLVDFEYLITSNLSKSFNQTNEPILLDHLPQNGTQRRKRVPSGRICSDDCDEPPGYI